MLIYFAHEYILSFQVQNSQKTGKEKTEQNNLNAQKFNNSKIHKFRSPRRIINSSENVTQRLQKFVL